MGGNLTSPLLDYNSTSLANTTHTKNTTNEADLVPACRECPNSAGICCPPNAKCDELGKCPWKAMEAMGYIRFGFNQVNWRNLSDGSYLGESDKMPLSGDVAEAARLASEAPPMERESLRKRGFEGMGMRDTGAVLAERERELKRRQGGVKQSKKRNRVLLVAEDAVAM